MELRHYIDVFSSLHTAKVKGRKAPHKAVNYRPYRGRSHLDSIHRPVGRVYSQAEAGAHGYRFGRKTFFSDVTRVFAEVSSWGKHRARSGQDFARQRFYHAR